MATQQLSDLITIEDLPQELDFIRIGEESVLEGISTRDLTSHSLTSQRIRYDLVLLLNKSVGFTIPWADIKIVLNPNFNTGVWTEIPISLEYEWKVLALLNNGDDFSISDFAFDGKAFFDLLSARLEPNEILLKVLTRIVNKDDMLDELGALNKFISDANAKYGKSIPAAVAPYSIDVLSAFLDEVTESVEKDLFTISFEIYIKEESTEDTLANVNHLFQDDFSIAPVDYIKSILLPDIDATLTLGETGIGIIFPRKYLVPLDEDNNLEPFPETGNDDEIMSVLHFRGGALSFSTERGLSYANQYDFELNHPSMIGNTGLILEINEAKLDLSRTTNIDEAIEDERPEDFIGVYIQEANITLPEKWFKNADYSTAKIFGRRLLIGTGGVSGEIGLEAIGQQGGSNGPPPAITARLGEEDGFEVGLERFSLTFRQNAITACDIIGYLKIEGFKNARDEDARIEVMISIGDNGDLSITALEEDGIKVLKIPDIFSITVTSLSVGRQDNRMFVAVSGILGFLNQSGNPNGSFIGDNLPKNIEIQRLIIWQDGSIEFEGGGITLRKPITMTIGPAELSITALHFGAHEQELNGVLRKYKFFGFDGGVSIKPGGVDARGDGIKFFFTVDNDLPSKTLDVFMRIQSIAIDIMIPGTATPETASVIMKGYLAMKSPSNGNNSAASTEYSGGIELSLPKLKMKGSAAMRFNPKVPAYVIDVGLELPNALLMGSTGLGIYAFRGLLGQRYVASREHIGLPNDAQWWEYYKKRVNPENREGIFISKMEQREGFTVGAGVSLCTVADSGNAFSSKLFFMLSLPEVFLLQGQANFLGERIGLNDINDPPFFALISISPTSIEAALGVNYKMPSSGTYAGKIVKLDGVLEMAFFWGNSLGWYLNIGRDTPEDQRIRARIFDLFDSYFFLMISGEGISAGAGASFKFDKTYLRAVRVKLQAYIDVRGKISFKPLQLGGSIQMGGSFAIRVFGIGFGLSAGTGLAAEAPKPLIISGFIYVGFEILWKEFRFKVQFTWSISQELNKDEIHILDPNCENIAKAINAHTGEAFPLLINNRGLWPPDYYPHLEDYTIPMDSFIDISFLQAVNPNGSDEPNDNGHLDKFDGVSNGFDYCVFVPPQRGKSPQIKHEFFVEKIELKIWDINNHKWEDYHPYKAMTPLADLPNIDLGGHDTFDDYVDGKDLKFGSWQVQQPGKYNYLRVLATNPLSYMTQNVDLVPEELHITSRTIFCPTPRDRRQKRCIDVAGLGRPHPDDGNILQVPANTSLVLQGVLFRINGEDGRVVEKPFGNTSSAVEILSGDALTIILPEASVFVSVRLKITTADVKIKYFKRVQTGVDGSQVPVYGWCLESVVTKSASMLAEPVVYSNTEQPVDKVVVTAGECPSQSNCVEYDGKAEALEEFLNQLIRAGRLGNGRRINIFSGVYSHHFVHLLQPGKLWNALGKSGVYLQSKFNADGSVFILVTSKSPRWRCEIKLVSRKINRLRNAKFVKFFNLRPDPNIIQEGENNDFLVDAELLLNGIKRIATFKGSSCIPLRICEPAGNIHYGEINEQGANMLSFLELLAERKRLVQARKLNISKGKFSDELSGIKRLNLFEPKGSLYYQSRLVSSNDVSINVNFDDESKYIFLETENEGFDGFSFTKITTFHNLRTDIGKKSFAERCFFLVDATCNNQTITLFGSTNINIYEHFSPEGIYNPPAESEQAQFRCDELTPEARALAGFLTTLCELNHLTSQRPRLLIRYPEYQNTYYSTALFPPYAHPDGSYWKMTGNARDYQIIRGLLLNEGKNEQFPCFFYLEIVTPYFKPNFVQMVRVYNIQADPQPGQVGVTYHFKAKALFNYHGQSLEADIKGKSCYPIAFCKLETCSMLVYQLCYLTAKDSIFNETIPSLPRVQQNGQAMVEAINKLIQPIWRPHSIFGILIRTRDKLTKEPPDNPSDNGNVTTYTRNYSIVFKTAGPPGHFHEYKKLDGESVFRADYNALLQADKEEEFKLKSLKYYIDMDKSYPNADGRLTMAKPLFCSKPRLLLFFVKDYVYAMYSSWASYKGNPGVESSIRLAIIDPTDNPGNHSSFSVEPGWEINQNPIIGSDIQVLHNFQENGEVCVQLDVIASFGMHAVFTTRLLKPQKTYTALFLARFGKDGQIVEREVHRYVFTTSRYHSFEEQVNSYRVPAGIDPVTKMATDREAVYTVKLQLTDQDIDTAKDILKGVDQDALKMQYIHIYDRLMSGGFKMPAQEAPLNTEFNIIRNAANDKVLGILVKNPEPFNDPKIPTDILNDKGMIWMIKDFNQRFHYVYSKDLSSVFITRSDNPLDMAGGDYHFTFRYLEYNQDTKAYVVAKEISNIKITI